MAVVSVTDNNTSVEDFEGAAPTIFDSGTGKASALETVTYFEGAQSLSRKVTGATINGTGITSASQNMNSGEVVMAKFLLTDYQDVNSVGFGFRLGSSTSNLYRYIVMDDGTLGDRGVSDVGLARGGWQILPIQPNNLDWFDVLDGTAPTLTAITNWQAFCGLNTGGAKCHAKGQGILMHDGSIKKVENIKVGDLVMGPDSKPRTVTGLSNGFGEMYTIIPKRAGQSWTVNADHMLTLIESGKNNDPIDISLKEWLAWPKHKKHVYKLFHANRVEFGGDKKELLIDPYFLGVMLGDGSMSQTPRITTSDKEIVQEIKKQCHSFNLRMTIDRKNRSAPTYHLSGCHKKPNPIANALRQLKLWNTNSSSKFIPHEYLTSSIDNRLEILAGLIDTDGTNHKSGYVFVSKSEQLANDVVFLARSLGFAATIKKIRNKCGNNGVWGIYYRVHLIGNDIYQLPLRLSRKKCYKRTQKKNPLRTGFNIKPAGTDDFYGFTVDRDHRYLLDDFIVTHNSENIFIDAIDISDGLFLVGGDSTDPDGTWQDFLNDDTGTAANRFGHVIDNKSGIELRGGFVRGRTNAASVTATVFTDTLQNLTWVGGLVGPGWNFLEDDLGNASTVITESNSAFVGKGRDNLKRYFDTDHQVDATNAVFSIVAHGFKTGEAVLYSNEGGAETPGPTSGTRYFVNRTTGTARGADGFSIHTTRANAYTNTSPVTLTASTSGNGENHSFRRQPDTRPDKITTGSTGSSSYTLCNFVRFRDFTETSGSTFTSCTIVSPNTITLGGTTLDTCTIASATTHEGESLCTGSVTEIENITDCTFTASDTGGHAIEITGTASTLDIVGNIFTNYGPDPEAGNGHSFDTTDGVGVDSTNDEIDYTSHTWTTGDPAYYSKYDPSDGSLGTDTIGLSDGDLVYVRSVTANSFSLHTTRYGAENNLDKITLNNTGTGEIHTFYSADAAIVNNTGGDVTINITGGGNSPSVRNIGASTSTVVSAVSVEVNGLTEGSRAIVIGTSGAYDGVTIVEGYANSSGIVSGSFGGSTSPAQPVIIRARNGGIINAAIQDDGGVFTDFTNNARTTTGSPGTGSTNDVDLTATTPAVNDAFYFGGLAQFGELDINITTAGSGYTASWDYWNGAWTALTVTDATNSFQTTGHGKVIFSMPSDWTTTSVNTQGPYYYIRLTIDSVTTPTQARADSVTLNDTVKYEPFESTGSITSNGLTVSAIWIEDVINI